LKLGYFALIGLAPVPFLDCDTSVSVQGRCCSFEP
jgi:hypothetical protein